jgi:hypothetical protein
MKYKEIIDEDATDAVVKVTYKNIVLKAAVLINRITLTGPKLIIVTKVTINIINIPLQTMMAPEAVKNLRINLLKSQNRNIQRSIKNRPKGLLVLDPRAKVQAWIANKRVEAAVVVAIVLALVKVVL